MVEIEELNQQAEIVDNPENAADLIKKYEEIFKTKRQGIISVSQVKKILGHVKFYEELFQGYKKNLQSVKRV